MSDESKSVKDAVSVLVYGRNDSHGYNLARRAASSLNAIAEVLREFDEIVFVDANGPDAFPTFPESISDTLTERARALLKVIRIRPSQYKQWTRQARLPVHEPFCRNVGLRRVGPDTRWILSTNTDILPVLRGNSSLTGLLASLEPSRLHIAPRIEVPEIVWEDWDRRDPSQMFAALGRCEGALDVVVETDSVTIHDGPGDFQLFPLSLGLKLEGFDESIVGGWHVDGNFCARSKLLTGANRSLQDKIYAYHLDHNRLATRIHKNRHSSETPAMLIHGIESAVLGEQAGRWGAPGADFEEIRLAQPGSFRFPVPIDVDKALHEKNSAPRISLNEGSFNAALGATTEFVFPHLVSHLSTFSASATIAYLGANLEMAELLACWLTGRGGKLHVLPGVVDGMETTELLPDKKSFEIVIVDSWSADLWDESISRDPRRISGALGERCRRIDRILMGLHRQVLAGKAGKPPLFLFVSCQHTWLDLDVHRAFDITLAPFGSRVRPGYARPIENPLVSWIRRKWARRRKR